MALAIVSFVLGKLSDHVVKEVLQLHGVGEQVDTLSHELSWVQAFLKDADMKQLVNEREKQWVKEIRDIAYDIEDVVDNAIFLKDPDNPSKEIPRRCAPIVRSAKRMWSKPKKLPALHKLTVEMNQILARIQQINESRVRYGINSLGEGSGERLRLPVRSPMLPDIDDPYVVGFEGDIDNILEQLLDTSTKRRAVISIVGAGGLGKTTLARKVYNSKDVKRQFDVRIWVTISQEFSLVDILRKMIELVEPLPQRDLEGGEEYLLTKLYKTLNGEQYTIDDYLHPNTPKEYGPIPIKYSVLDSQLPKTKENGPIPVEITLEGGVPKKYLLVLDDTWTNDLWIRIGGVLPDAMNGSRVIITSRFLDIADDAKPYKLQYLTEKPSIELFFKKALPNRESKEYPYDLYEVGIQFVKKCGGLPLALMVLGSLLSKKPANHAAWSKMLRTMNWSTDGRACTEIIATSYNDLPFVLKSCFMYFAVFPEDYEIDAQRLLRLWVAEGLIPEGESRTLEDTAERFLEELVQRSLVQVSQRSHTGSITSCRVHDVLRQVALDKAKDDNFLKIFSNPDDLKSPAHVRHMVKARRVAVHYSGCDELMKQANPNLRSLLCFEKPLPNCSRLRLLKVLSDIGQSRLVNFEGFHGLTQLRYCELRGSGSMGINRRSFESFIGGLKFVETLDFRYGDLPDLPDEIWNVKTLRHVMLKEYTLGPSSSADLRNLQTLTGVRCRASWNNKQFPNLPNVHDLNIKLPKSCSWDLIIQLLGTLKHLTCLSLVGYDVPQEIVNMQRFPFYGDLQSLSLLEKYTSISMMKKLLPEVGMFPIHVTGLTLVGLQFQDNPLLVLEKLCSLRVLHLEGEIEIQMMSCSAGGFQQLHELKFVHLTNLEEWEIKAGAMPILKVVKLMFCNKLRVPLGLQYLSNLNELEVLSCKELNMDAKDIRDNICKHVPYISIVQGQFDL